MENHIDTTWEVWTSDILGHPSHWQTINRRCVNRKCPIRCKIKTGNKGALGSSSSVGSFSSASPSIKQIREALGLTGMKDGIQTGGDDVHIIVEKSRNGYPLGELICTSHDSLSPIRVKG